MQDTLLRLFSNHAPNTTSFASAAFLVRKSDVEKTQKCSFGLGWQITCRAIPQIVRNPVIARVTLASDSIAK